MKKVIPILLAGVLCLGNASVASASSKCTHPHMRFFKTVLSSWTEKCPENHSGCVVTVRKMEDVQACYDCSYLNKTTYFERDHVK